MADNGLNAGGKRRVLVAVDGSECSKAAFEYAISRLVQPETDHLVILHVCMKSQGKRGAQFAALRPQWSSRNSENQHSKRRSLELVDDSTAFDGARAYQDDWDKCSLRGNEACSVSEGRAEGREDWRLPATWQRQRQERLSYKGLMEKLSREADQMGIEHEVDVLEAVDAGEAITTKAEEVAADILVIGGTSIDSLSQHANQVQLDGCLSTSAYCRLYSTCPVMVVCPTPPPRAALCKQA